MGYALHISRGGDRAERQPIRQDEWKAYLDQDPEMQFAGQKVSLPTPDGKKLELESEGFGLWRHAGNQYWFDYGNGEISVIGVDDVVIQKAVSIAGALGARVFGDEGEEYR